MINDGGPAFPAPSEFYLKEGLCGRGEPVYRTSTGMSLRDYLAGQALNGHLSRQSLDNSKGLTAEELVKACYKIADAMIAERSRRNKQPTGEKA